MPKSPAHTARIPKLGSGIGLGRKTAGPAHLCLREMRELAGLTQVQLAEKLKKAQAEVSKLERREDFHLSTLRDYVKALGGEIEVVVRFGERTVRLRNL